MFCEYNNWSSMGFWGFFQIIFWVLIFYVIYWVINSNKVNLTKNSNLNSVSPKDILKKRLANGEISKKEYKEILKEIEE